jgi:hypothetical protein
MCKCGISPRATASYAPERLISSASANSSTLEVSRSGGSLGRATTRCLCQRTRQLVGVLDPPFRMREHDLVVPLGDGLGQCFRIDGNDAEAIEQLVEVIEPPCWLRDDDEPGGGLWRWRREAEARWSSGRGGSGVRRELAGLGTLAGA